VVVSVVCGMAALALAFPPKMEKSSEGRPHLVCASLTGGPVSANVRPLGTSVGEDCVDPQKRSSRQYSDGSSGNSGNTSTNSWEDYDALDAEPGAVVRAFKDAAVVGKPTLVASEMHTPSPGQGGDGQSHQRLESLARESGGSPAQRRQSVSIHLEKTDEGGRYLLTADDSRLREILRRGVECQSQGPNPKRPSRFSDLIFTRQLTAFDRQNPISASSPFHGFYTLFWLGTALLLLRVGANNWRTYGSVCGRHEIMTMMFHRDVALLGLTDGVMCASTLFCLILQRAITRGYLSWNKQGWIIQNVSIIRQLSQERFPQSRFSSQSFSVPIRPCADLHLHTQLWQAFYLGVVIAWTIHRLWPWTHTVFIVLHCLVMLMKQHSYAAFNGYRKSFHSAPQVTWHGSNIT